MKKIVLLFLVLSFMLQTGCSMYSVKRDKKGIYKTAELEYNMLSKNDGNGYMFFNFIKYVHGSESYCGVKILYSYTEPGLRFNIMGLEIGGGFMFGIKNKKGVKVVINGGEPVFLSYKTSPKHVVYSSAGQPRSHSESLECSLSPDLLKALVTAKSITVTLYGTDPSNKDKAKVHKAYFKKDNLKVLERFYNEEIKKKNTKAGE